MKQVNITRYYIDYGFYESSLSPQSEKDAVEEDAYGDWCRWEEVKNLLEELGYENSSN